MALQVFIAHSGQRLQADSEAISSVDAFKTWVAKNSSIAPSDHIFLTAQGKAVRQLRQQTLQTEKEIYVYDSRIIQSSSTSSTKSPTSEIPLPDKYSVAKPPDTIGDQTNLQAWKDLFEARHSWTQKVLGDCADMSATAQQRYDEIYIITQCLEAAYRNLEIHIKSIEEEHRDFQSWASDVQKDQAIYGTDLEASLAQMRSIPASSQMLKFITGRTFRSSKQSPTLVDLIDVDDLKKAGKVAGALSAQMARNSADLKTRIDKLFRGTDALNDKFEKSPNRNALRSSEESLHLLQDIEAIAKKVGNDYENVLGYANTSKNISQASKSALLHTRNLLPSLSKRSVEMNGILRVATELRNSVAAESLETMQDLAGLTALLADLKSRLSTISLDNDGMNAFNTLTSMHTLPVTYAAFLAESIKRREWNEKVKSDSSTLVNDLAVFEDEEARRRRKWQKSTGAILWGDKVETSVLGLEVTLHGEEQEWPETSRKELDDIVAVLQSRDANLELANEVSRIISELNNPTKQQIKRAKAFKAGSVHEAALGRSTLLMRGDDEMIRSLQQEKSKTESKLKTAESRVRRLEDLLHRQSHVSRTSTGNIFHVASPSPEAQLAINPLASPRLQDNLSRRSSTSSRRFSATQGADEKAVQHKLMSLEAELIAERERLSGMEKEISAKTHAAHDMRTQFEEANAMKKDLMDNFDAQQREFIEERKSLEGEIKRLKAKNEDLEDEMDRFLGSRENVDDRVRSLQDEVERLRKENGAEAQKAQGQVDFLRGEANLQRETNETLERQLEKLREENKILTARAIRAESSEEEQLKAFEDIHGKLSPGASVPHDFSILANVILQTTEDVVADLETNKREIAIAKADADAAGNTIADLKAELTTTRERLSAEEKETSHLREALSSEKAKFVALEAELADERLQLSSLRTKIADGETGSEAIQSRLEEEERKVTSLSEDLASRMSHIGSLEEELRMTVDKLDSSQTKFKQLAERFEVRTVRTKDLSQRLYAQNDQLCILLEQLSYSVTREAGSMTIQRMPKPDRSTHNDLSDPGSSLRRSISGAIMKKVMTDSGDLELLYWMNSDDTETESPKYEAFLNVVDCFDMEAFCNTIMKRVRDLDYTVRKYSRDARAYREKSHGAQKEAHEKIAFKSFKEGDLALFLPTRNQATGAWAAFNVGAPHYFLREQDSHKLRHRDWLVARITKIEDRVVDLSKSMSSTHLNVSEGRSFGETSNGGDSFEDDNPFDLSDGLRWYLIDAHEEKPGAPSTPGLGKSTVASTHVDASGDIRRTKKSSSGGVEGINKTLSKSLDSRRSSNTSKKSLLAISKPVQGGSGAASLKSIPAGQPVDGVSDAQATGSSSRQEPSQNDTGDRTLTTEVGNHNIDELMGP
ncbi:hypothetical protein BP5796_08090 [Coleophoma crateriformis]|uniref:Autophagy-related protein 11 n=1 Tax=Coleophoma crateriformis TaxID=565419 RepID=A0A3D8RDN6_9HELO|nr:hypothetical protein BP5796_08090 [Coleophoma crateriformis]